MAWRGSPITPVVIAIAQNVRARRGRYGWLHARPNCLPVPYFHVVFTLPAPVGAVAFQNKAAVYAILFAAAAEAMMTLAANPRRLGAQIGVVAVLHTWGQALTHHPHVHCVVPGGGLSPDGTRWIAGRPNFFLAVRPLAKLFRRLFLERLQKAYDAGALNFFGDLVDLANPASFGSPRRGHARHRLGRLCKSLSVEPPRRSPISVAIHTASPLPTAAWPPSKTITSLSPGRIIARTAPARS